MAEYVFPHMSALDWQMLDLLTNLLINFKNKIKSLLHIVSLWYPKQKFK